MKAYPKKINANDHGEKYLKLLGGPPETVTLRSGKVTLQPGETVGEHSTDSYEEIIIVLAGEGEFEYSDSGSIPFDADSVLYCPPNTTHNIRNAGSTPLQYIYVVGKAIPDRGGEG